MTNTFLTLYIMLNKESITLAIKPLELSSELFDLIVIYENKLLPLNEFFRLIFNHKQILFHYIHSLHFIT